MFEIEVGCNRTVIRQSSGNHQIMNKQILLAALMCSKQGNKILKIIKPSNSQMKPIWALLLQDFQVSVVRNNQIIFSEPNYMKLSIIYCFFLIFYDRNLLEPKEICSDLLALFCYSLASFSKAPFWAVESTCLVILSYLMW